MVTKTCIQKEEEGEGEEEEEEEGGEELYTFYPVVCCWMFINQQTAGRGEGVKALIRNLC